MSKIGKKEQKILNSIARKKLKDFENTPLAEKVRNDLDNIRAWQPKAFETPEEMETAIMEYIEEQKQRNKPLTITWLALSLGIDRQTLINYSRKDKYFDVVNKRKQYLLSSVEENLTDKATFTPWQIFYLKNNYKQDYQDKIDFDGNVNITSLVDLHKLADNIIEGEIIEEPTQDNISLQEGTPQEENTFAEEDTR
jgi:hypothetical protein